MVMIVVNRKELGSFFATFDSSQFGEISLDPEKDLLNLRPASGALFFDEPMRAGNLPRRIVIRDDERDDFFAWTSTFIEALSPLTGFIEVETVSEATTRRVSPYLGPRETNGLIAAVIVDALLQSRAKTRVPDTILPAALRTLSAVFYQAAVAGSRGPEIADAASLWALTRETLGASELPFGINHVLTFWRRIMSALFEVERTDPLAQVVHRFFKGGIPDWESPWQDSPWARKFFVDPTQMAAASREERLRYVDRVIASLDQSVDSDGRAAFGGYLLSLVADGDFNLWPTSQTYDAYPSLPLWFGLFVGGVKRSNVLSLNQSIGRRLVNLLQYRPDDIDIDARELLVSRRLRRRPASAVDFPLATLNVVKVRLAHHVCGWFSAREAVQPQQMSARDQGRASAIDVRAIVEARILAERIQIVLSPLIHGAASVRQPPGHERGEDRDLPSPQDIGPSDIFVRLGNEQRLPLDVTTPERRKGPANKKQQRKR